MSMNITEHTTLELKNVLSYRAKMNQQEFAMKLQEIEQIMQARGCNRSAPIVTATFAIESNGMMDVEILVPLDRKLSIPSGYTWKTRFFLTNALRVKHVGNPAKLQMTLDKLNEYIETHQLVPITVGYNVTVKDGSTSLELDEVEIDIYVGISPNQL